MTASLRRTAASLAFLAGLFAGPAAAFDTAQSRIDFGQAGAEDFLDGASASGPAAVSGGERRSRWDRDGRGRYDRYDRDGRADRGYRYGWTESHRPQRFRYSSRSIIYVEPRPSYFRGTGVFANANPAGGSFISFDALPSAGSWNGAGSGPKFIDVESERLDRHPIGASGISVHYSGSAKIIRIDPTYRMSALASEEPREWSAAPMRSEPLRQEEQAGTTPAPAQDDWVAPSPAAAPVPSPSAAPRETAVEPALEPWTDEWLRDCVSRHETFDASLGTYTDEAGRRRFCTGDPA